jgi:NAD(P)-dependent dehydrogenase (short-subunit alcohol dehydrogenase family)
VVNNAGIARYEPAATSDDFRAWKAMVSVNLEAVFRLCRLAGRELLAGRHGGIINMGSIGAASALIASQPGYAATKATPPQRQRRCA